MGDKIVKYFKCNGNFTAQGSYNAAGNTTNSNFNIDSKSCLSLIKGNNNGTIGCKYFKNFIQPLEHPAVKENVGNELKDYISNTGKYLKEAIPNIQKQVYQG